MKLASSLRTWRIPESWGAETAGHPIGARLGQDLAATAPGKLKIAFIVCLLSLTVLDRFGLRLSDTYSLNPSLLALFALVATMLLTRSAQVNGTGAAIYAAIAALAVVTFLVNLSLDYHQVTSLGSLLLVLVLYSPFIISLRPTIGTAALWRWMINAYILSAVWIAAAGVLQFYAQFAIHVPWLFDYTTLIPMPIRSSGLYNTVNPVGSLIKSNGFFLKEASGFSGASAFAFICEWGLKRRKLVLAVLGLGILVSYSGSGPVLLAVALLFPLGFRTLARLLGCVIVGTLVVLLLGDALNLSYTVNRANEFQSDKSSAYCRFIAPGKLIAEQIDSAPWTTLVGHGPGTTQKLFKTCETTYAKVLFEYGLLGAVLFSALVIAAINRSSAHVRVRAALVVGWYLLGGNLLAPESLLLIYLISGVWPPKVGAEAIAELDRLPPLNGVFKRLA